MPIEYVDEDVYKAYEPYAVSDELSLLIPADDDGCPFGAYHVSESKGLDLQPLLNCVTELVGEKMQLKRDFAERKTHIASLETQLHVAYEEVASSLEPAGVTPHPRPLVIFRVLRSNFSIVVSAQQRKLARSSGVDVTSLRSSTLRAFKWRQRCSL